MAIAKQKILGEVSNYQFQSIDGEVVGNRTIQNFSLKELDGKSFHHVPPSPQIIRKEREAARKTLFKIDDAIIQHRGLAAQAESDFQKTVANEVEARLKKMTEESIQKGYEEGFKAGEQKAYQEATQQFSMQIQEIAKIVEQVKTHRNEVFQQNKLECYEMVRALTKWILLKEIKNDDYLKNLLEKLILELGVKTNLILKVNKRSFQHMPTVLKDVEEKLGKLTNVRVEIDQEMHLPGIIIESSSGLLDGSVKAQFMAIDNIFKAVDLKPSDFVEEIEEQVQTQESNSEVKDEVKTDEDKKDDE